jgi:hypothetical protein
MMRQVDSFLQQQQDDEKTASTTPSLVIPSKIALPTFDLPDIARQLPSLPLNENTINDVISKLSDQLNINTKSNNPTESTSRPSPTSSLPLPSAALETKIDSSTSAVTPLVEEKYIPVPAKVDTIKNELPPTKVAEVKEIPINPPRKDKVDSVQSNQVISKSKEAVAEKETNPKPTEEDMIVKESPPPKENPPSVSSSDSSSTVIDNESKTLAVSTPPKESSKITTNDENKKSGTTTSSSSSSDSVSTESKAENKDELKSNIKAPQETTNIVEVSSSSSSQQQSSGKENKEIAATQDGVITQPKTVFEKSSSKDENVEAKDLSLPKESVPSKSTTTEEVKSQNGAIVENKSKNDGTVDVSKETMKEVASKEAVPSRSDESLTGREATPVLVAPPKSDFDRDDPKTKEDNPAMSNKGTKEERSTIKEDLVDSKVNEASKGKDINTPSVTESDALPKNEMKTETMDPKKENSVPIPSDVPIKSNAPKSKDDTEAVSTIEAVMEGKKNEDNSIATKAASKEDSQSSNEMNESNKKKETSSSNEKDESESAKGTVAKNDVTMIEKTNTE